MGKAVCQMLWKASTHEHVVDTTLATIRLLLDRFPPEETADKVEDDNPEEESEGQCKKTKSKSRGRGQSTVTAESLGRDSETLQKMRALVAGGDKSDSESGDSSSSDEEIEQRPVSKQKGKKKK